MNAILEKKQIVNSTYEVQFFIGGNTICEKYRVKGNDGKTYLLKLYNSSKLSTNDFSGSNLLEVEILASLNVDNTVKLVNNGEYVKGVNKYHFVVLEFISGESIEDKLERDGAFTQFSAVSIIIDLLKTLDKLHYHPKTIIHNNINPSSVSFDYSINIDKPILQDFRFARFQSNDRNIVDINMLSPFYIAPELYQGYINPRSDIFSVGALLFYLLTGKPPWYCELPTLQYSDEKFIEIISEKRKEPLNFIIKGTFDSFEDEHIKDVIKKSLALNIEERFKNVEEFIRALELEVVYDGEKDKTIKNVSKKKGKGFSAIAGMDIVKDILHNDIIRALKEKERFAKYEIPLPNGMLLYGPPGCGKTFIAEKFAEEVGFNFIKIITSDIASTYFHGTQEKIGKLFKEAEKNAPTVMFIDEVDAMVPKRGENLQQGTAAEVNEFLAQLNNCGERGIFVIAATNRPDMIDTAILRAGRIDYKIYLPPPDFEARKGLFKNYLQNKYVEIDIDYELLAKQTENYVSVDIKTIVDFAARTAERKDVRISQNILNETIKQRLPSISIDELNAYTILKDKLENNKANKDEQRRPIGFK